MHITNLKIKDLRNLEYFESPMNSAVLIVCGRNGSGKTTILEAFRWIFNGGVSPRLLRDGADEGWAEFTLSNGYTAKERIWRKKTGGFDYQLTVSTPDGAECPKPKTLLDSWMPEQAFDADWFVEQSPRERVKFLLKYVKIEFTGAEINAALTPPVPDPQIIPMTQRATEYVAKLDAEISRRAGASVGVYPPGEKFDLEKFDAILALQESRRSEFKRRVKELEGTIKTLGTGLETPEETDWGAECLRLGGELRRVESSISSTRSQLQLESQQRISAKRTAIEAALSQRKDAVAAYVAKVNNFQQRVAGFASSDGQRQPEAIYSEAGQLEKDAIEFVANVRAITQLKMDLLDFETAESTNTARAIIDMTAALEEERRTLSVDFGVASTRANRQQQVLGIRNTIAEQQEYLRCLGYSEDELSRCIRALEEIKALKLKAIAIEGFDISFVKNEPRISINGRDFDSLNFQSQLFLAFKFIRLAKPEMAFIICESANAIDSSNLEALNSAAEAAGVQFLLERCIADQPLRMMPAPKFIEAERAGEIVIAEKLGK